MTSARLSPRLLHDREVKHRLKEDRDPRTRHERKFDALAQAEAEAEAAHAQANLDMLGLHPAT